jgi:hypothetical protein
MKDLKSGGMKELAAFKNRLGRAYGRGEVDRDDFERISDTVELLLDDLRKLKTEEERRATKWE